MGLELVAAAVQRAVVGKPGNVSFSISILQCAIFKYRINQNHVQPNFKIARFGDFKVTPLEGNP